MKMVKSVLVMIGVTAFLFAGCKNEKVSSPVESQRSEQPSLLSGEEPIVIHLRNRYTEDASPAPGAVAFTLDGHDMWAFSDDPLVQIAVAPGQKDMTCDVFGLGCKTMCVGRAPGPIYCAAE